MNSRSGTIGFNHKRKAASKKQSLDPDRTRQDMLEEEDESMEMSNIEETDDNENTPPLSLPKISGSRKKQSPRTVSSSLEESEDSLTLNTPPKKSREKESASRTTSLGAAAVKMDQGNLDFSMNSSESESVTDRQSPVIKLGGDFSVLEMDSPYATKSVTIRRRCRRTDGGGFSDQHLHLPFRILPSLALAGLQYCSIVPEINAIIRSDSNFTLRLKVIQKKLRAISGK